MRRLRVCCFSLAMMFFASTATASGTEPVRIKILSFNAWFLRIPLKDNWPPGGPPSGAITFSKDIEERLALMPAEVARVGADIIALQEMWDPQVRDRVLIELARLGYGYAVFINRGRLYAETQSLRGVLGNGLVIASRFPYARPSLHSFKDYTAREEYFARKGVLHLEFDIPGVGWVDFYNTHLGSVNFDPSKNEFDPGQSKRRFAQARELAEFYTKTARHAVRFVAGDLNADPFEFNSSRKSYDPARFSPEYTLLTRELGLVDSFHEVQGFPEPPLNTYDPMRNFYASGSSPIGDYFDYVLAGVSDKTPEGCVRPIRSEIVFTDLLRSKGKQVYLSDHYGVLSEFEVACGGVNGSQNEFQAAPGFERRAAFAFGSDGRGR